jgi:hypothetical protein
VSNDMIKKESFSYEEILADLKKVLAERYSETDAAWEDFYAFGTGQIILELLSGLGAFTTYTAIANRREAYMNQTVLASSARAIAAPLGYSAYRGNNASLRVSMYAHGLTTIDRFDKLGSYEDESGNFDLIALAPYTISPPSSENSLASDVEVVIGSLESARLIIPSYKPQIFRFTQERISDSFYLKVNGTIVPHSEDVIDLIKGMYVCLTNANGSVDVMAMNEYLEPEHKFRAGYELEIIFVALHEIQRPKLTNVSLEVGTVENVIIGRRYQAPDTVEEIQVKAPLRHETGRVIRGRDDYMKRVRQHLPNVVDVAAKDLDSATLNIAYIIDSADALTDSEMATLQDNIANEANRPMGVKPPSLTAGNLVNIGLDVQVVLRDSLVSTASVVDDVVQSLRVFEKKLSKRTDLYDLEDAIRSALTYAKAIRVTLTPDPDLSEDELADWNPLNIGWNQYMMFQPRVKLLDTATDFFSETAAPVQAPQA